MDPRTMSRRNFLGLVAGTSAGLALAGCVLTTLPILALYAIGRRQLLSGLTAGFSK